MDRAFVSIACVALLAMESMGQSIVLPPGQTNEIDRSKVRSQKTDTTRYPSIHNFSSATTSDLSLKQWGRELGFQQVLIPNVINSEYSSFYKNIPDAAERRTAYGERRVAPYLSIENGRIFDVVGPGIHVLNSTLTRWGAGLQYRVYDNVSLDASVRYEVTEYFSGYLFMIGINITF
jgi:hypothetical protein